MSNDGVKRIKGDVMARALSNDMRQRIISYNESGLTPTEIAKRLLICVRTVSRIKKLYRETGSLAVKKHPKISKKRVFLKDPKELVQFVHDNPDLSGKEIAAHFGCSPALICVRLREANITYKKNLYLQRTKHPKKTGFQAGTAENSTA